jgi:5-methylcytosine-specific restriction endonuclease McrA
MPSRTGRPWQRKKARVIRRDGGICHLCGQPGADSADHLVPYSQGGTDAASNLAAVHHNAEPRCNRIRGNRDIETARAELTPPSNETPGWSW